MKYDDDVNIIINAAEEGALLNRHTSGGTVWKRVATTVPPITPARMNE